MEVGDESRHDWIKEHMLIKLIMAYFLAPKIWEEQ
jgi:hypothetical protein